MKKHYLWLALVMLGICTSIKAQITVTNSVFPVVGDTLHYLIGNQPGAINQIFTPPGLNQSWDLSGLQPSQVWDQIMKDPQTGTAAASFPGASVLFNPVNSNSQVYWQVTNDQVFDLGYFGLDELGLGLNLLFKKTPALEQSWAPANFLDLHQSASNVLTAFDAPIAPPVLLNLVPTADSFRIRVTYQRIASIDASGTLAIPGGSFDVLRKKQTEYKSMAVDVKVAPLGWIDISTIGGQQLLPLGTDTITTFHFLNDVSKEEIAICTLNTGQNTVTSVQYKAVSASLTAGVSAVVSPICSGQDAVFSLTGTPNAEVTYNINGGGNQMTTLNGIGQATVTVSNATSDQTVNLVSVRNTSTNETVNLNKSATVTVIAFPTASVSAAITPICSGQNAVFNLTGTPNTEVFYTINGGNGQTVMLDGNGAATVTIMNVTQNQTFNLISVSYANFFCSQFINSSATVVVSAMPAPTADIGPNPAVVCSGEQIMLNGNPMGGDGNFTHAWTGAGAAFLSATNVVNPTFSPNAPGSYLFTYTATDGNNCMVFDTMTVKVLNCEVSISDPCSCKNNATTLTNGQFDETVEVLAPSGQSWTVANGTTGLYTTGSAAPPAAPTPIAIGTPLTEIPLGAGTSRYILTGLHVDAIGYSFTATNGDKSPSISNTCYYPNPAIVGLDATYCVDASAVTLMGTIDRGDGQAAAMPESTIFDILNNANTVIVPNATMFDPSSLGAGTYSVRYTVDGANEGAAFPGCVQAVSQMVSVVTSVSINPLMPQTTCATKKVPVSVLYKGLSTTDNVELTYTWTIKETVGDNGMLSNLNPADPTAGTYMPGAAAIDRGYVTLILTVENACEPTSAEVQIKILKVDCGAFPWNGD